MDHSFYGTPVIASNLEIPLGTKTVRVVSQVMGPDNPHEFGVSVHDCEVYVYFKSDMEEPIGFALLAAAKKMPNKRMTLVSSINKIDRFDMPMRFVDGIKGALEAFREQGWRIIVDYDLLDRIKNDEFTRKEE